jgi:hypothetical protein
MTLYSRDNTIRGLNERVAKITKRAEEAGILLSPSPPKEDASTFSKQKRALYRDELVDLETGEIENGSVLPPPKGQEGSPMVMVNKGMWDDPRVYSPTKGVKNSNGGNGGDREMEMEKEKIERGGKENGGGKGGVTTSHGNVSEDTIWWYIPSLHLYSPPAAPNSPLSNPTLAASGQLGETQVTPYVTINL